MTIVDHDEAEHKGRGRDESSLDDVVPCIIYNQRSHGLSGEADRNCWLAILHLDASLSTRSVMVVAGPEMAAGRVGIAAGANGNGVGQRQARPVRSVRTIKRTGPPSCLQG
jgi:hypothetical protein